MDTAVPYHVMGGGEYDFVAYANLDSVPFWELYRIPEARTVVRGSLRYTGNPAFVQALARLGWQQERKEWLHDGMTWAQIQQQALMESMLCPLRRITADVAIALSLPASRKSPTFQPRLRVNASSSACTGLVCCHPTRLR
jgi:hypothetical protein